MRVPEGLFSSLSAQAGLGPPRTFHPIACPNQDNIELAAASIAHHLVKSRPLGLCPGDPIRILVHDLIATLDDHCTDTRRQSSPLSPFWNFWVIAILPSCF
jgi:hypothetical protein